MKVKSNEEIESFLRNITDPLGVELVEVNFKQGKNPSLTVYIDKEGGVDLNTCELVHRAIDEPLDQLDPTYDAPYTLNVSSLGLDRPFKTPRDFERNLNKAVEVKLYASVKGKKTFEGVLVYYDDEKIRVKINEKETLTFDRGQIVKVSKYIEM